MMRFITHFTLIPTFFTFITIILINVGGVNPEAGSKYERQRERNSAFSLLKWEYAVTAPQQSTSRQSLHVYLNRVCAGYMTSGVGRYPSVFQCLNDRVSRLEDGTRLFSSSLFSRTVSPFRFDTVNFDIPLAFYILAVVQILPLMVMAFGASKSTKRRGIRGAAALLTAMAFISMLIASSVITSQMVRLRNQIRDDTRTSIRGPTNSFAGGTTNWRVNVTDVKLGTTVLGLTWAAVVALMIEFGMWLWAFMEVKNETPPMMELKREEYVQG